MVQLERFCVATELLWDTPSGLLPSPVGQGLLGLGLPRMVGIDQKQREKH